FLQQFLFADYACRSCGRQDLQVVVDLGFQPLANSYLSREALMRMEPTYPLTMLHCVRCHLVQIPPMTTPHEIFSEYLYMSSFSPSWLEHSRLYVEHVTDRFNLGPQSCVIEIGSNDGYLLQFAVAKGIR